MRKAKPEDEIFVAKRAWDQRAESGYMKRIEDSFQQLASDILAGNVCHVGDADKETINRFYALWWTRARHRDLPQQEIQMNAVTGGGLTRDQEEMLEKNGYTTRKPAALES